MRNARCRKGDEMKFALGVLLLLLCAGCATMPEDDRDYVNERACDFYGRSFCLLSGHFRPDVVYAAAGPDFFTYVFVVDDTSVLQIYEGNYAQQFGPERYAIKSISGQSIKFRDFDDGKEHHYYYINDAIDFPSELHFWHSDDLEPEIAEGVQAAMSSLRYCRPEGASMICE
jgi:hypothetical protein